MKTFWLISSILLIFPLFINVKANDNELSLLVEDFDGNGIDGFYDIFGYGNVINSTEFAYSLRYSQKVSGVSIRYI